MMTSTNERGSAAEKYAKAWLEARGYLCDIHPRTSTFTGKFYISRENDFFNAADIIGYGKEDAVLVQVTDTGGETLTISDGNVAKRRDKLDKNFPLNPPYLHILVILTQKQWVHREGERRHKEYFHRAWQREVTNSGQVVWVERKAWSHLP